MIKFTTFSTHDNEGHSLVHVIHGDVLEKSASYKKDVEDFVHTFEKKADHTYLLVNAMTSGDYYGENLNGDYFPDDQLQRYHKTFEKNAHFYRHHKNKNPEESMGKVVYASHNPDMHRVELVIEVENSKAPDIMEKLAKNENIAVSMGVRTPSDKCLDTTTKIYTDRGVKFLKNVTVEDKIFTHTGNLQSIEAVSSRVLSKYIEMGIFGDYEVLRGSHEHPFYIVPRENFIMHGVIRKKNNTGPTPEWKNMEDLRVGDYLVVKRSVKSLNDITPTRARILGYFISEGSIIRERAQVNYKKTGSYKIMGVRFSFSLDERNTFVEDLNQALLQEGLIAKIYEHPDKFECTLQIYSKDLALFLIKYGGEYSHTKKLHPDIFRHPEDTILNILGTAINGDGSQDHNKHKGTIRYTSVSEQLARDLRRLALEVGVPASINKYIGNTFGEETKGSIIYSVHIPASASGKISLYSSKCKEYKTNVGSRLFVYPEFILVPILRLEEKNESLEVANLQIAEDESYQALDYVTHNCSICGNRAKNTAEYCDHLKYEMRRVMPDGRKVAALNDDRLTFFDISAVRIPADRTAGVISKVAAVGVQPVEHPVIPSALIGEEWLKRSGLKESALTKEVPGTIEGMSQDPYNLILDSQRRIPKETIDKLAEEHSLGDILSTFLGLRICPRPEEFQRLVLLKMDRKPLADQVLEKGIILMDMDEQPQIPIDVTVDGFNHEVASKLMDLLPDLALTKPLIIRRVLIKRAELEEKREGLVAKMTSLLPTVGSPQGPRPSTYAPGKNPLFPLIGLGGLFAGFAKAMTAVGTDLTKFDKLDAMLIKNPYLIPLFVGAVALGTEGAQHMLFREKHAAKIPAIAKSIAIGVPASYLYAGSQENKLQKGQPISKFQDLVRKHPFLSGMAGIGAHAYLWPKIRKDLAKLGSLDRVVYGLGPEKFDELYNDVVGITNP
jgi:hypothetical protein